MSRPTVIRTYHGTTARSAQSILKHGFKASRNEFDWLGDGVYFFRDAPMRAWEWARSRHGATAAALEARVRLRDRMDLLDIGRWGTIRECDRSFLREVEESRRVLPGQTFGARRLDRQVLNDTVDTPARAGYRARSFRAVFIEGNRAFPNSELFDLAHVQRAVRDPSVIDSIRLILPGKQ